MRQPSPAGAAASTAGAGASTAGAGPRADRSGQILDAVEARLCNGGIRSVVMSELAAELGMSTKTLYTSFASKDALVTAVVERWAQRLLAAQQRRRDSEMSVSELVRTAAQFQVRWRSRFSPEFWADLESDHPEAWARYQRMLDEGRRASNDWMSRSMRDGIDVTAARAMLVASIEGVTDPALRSTTGLSRTAAIDLATDVWSRGVFVDPDAPPPPPA